MKVEPRRPRSGEDREELYSIGRVAEGLGVHPRTLMAYERLGLVRPARRSGRRAYSAADRRWLTCLREFNREGGVSLQGLSTLLQFVPCWAIRSELTRGGRKVAAVPSDYPASDCLDRVTRAYSGEACPDCRSCDNYRGGSGPGREALDKLSQGVCFGGTPAGSKKAPGARAA